MADWKTYKGQGAWAFEKSASKPRYNEGSSIATSEDPTWDTYDFTGEPVTNGHDPCGYWHQHPVFPEPPEPPFHFEKVTKIGLTGQRVAWGPVARSPLNGCFVKTLNTNIYSSDDGGLTWTLRKSTAAAGANYHEITYKNGMFIAFKYKIIFYSTDAITWYSVDTSTFYADVDGFYSIDYNSYMNKFVLALDRASTNVKYIMYGNASLTSFVYKAYSFNSYNKYEGNKAFQGYQYLGASNDSYFWRSQYLSETSNDWVRLTWPGTLDEANICSDGSTVMLFGNKYSLNGTTWKAATAVSYDSNGAIIYSYNSRLGFLGKWKYYTGSGTRDDFYHSRNGIDWTLSYSELNLTSYDHAIGNNGFVAVGVSSTLIMKKVYDDTPVFRALWESGKQRWLNYKGQVPWTI